LLAGFRFAELTENLDIHEGATNLNSAEAFFPYLASFFSAPGSRHDELDTFATRNDFFGGQIGGSAEIDWGRFYARATGKMGLGASVERLAITGATKVVPAAGDITAPNNNQNGTGGTIIPFVPVSTFGGLLTNPANIGIHTRSVITTLNQLDVELGWNVTSYLRVFAGYSFIYWGNVLRPGNQIDILINQKWQPSGVSFNNVFNGNPYPRILWQQSDFWATGCTFGAELRF
jgi:hypothetical protein